MTQACIIKLLIASYYPKEAITHRNEVVKEYINHVSHPLICIDIPNDLVNQIEFPTKLGFLKFL